jgi:hypothetical protein
VRVAAPPTDGRANAGLIALLASALQVPQSAVQVATGHGGRDKCIEVDGVERADVERALDG